jgi:circadian clock protein KaiB
MQTLAVPGQVARVRKAVIRLCLYIADQTPRSMNAVANVRQLCDEELQGQCLIKIIDVLEHPEMTVTHNIVALPTLVRESPLPECRVIGDLSDTFRVLKGLKVPLSV